MQKVMDTHIPSVMKIHVKFGGIGFKETHISNFIFCLSEPISSEQLKRTGNFIKARFLSNNGQV